MKKNKEYNALYKNDIYIKELNKEEKRTFIKHATTCERKTIKDKYGILKYRHYIYGKYDLYIY